MKPWEIDDTWARGHGKEIAKIIRSLAGDILYVRAADEDEDIHKATDIVVGVKEGAIACRIRRPGYLETFGDMTIRYSRPTGTSTEFEKIKKGFGRWYLYAWTVWVGEDEKIESWVFIDLDRLRASGLLDNPEPIYNLNGTSFIAISLEDLENAGCIVRRFP